MLDTYGRKYVDPVIYHGAKFFLKLGLSPTNVTILALIVGLMASVFLIAKMFCFSVVLLWISGYLDTVDGAMARLARKTSDLGTLLDVVFDRMVEIGLIIALTLNEPSSGVYFVGLTGSIILSMTIFLTVGALVRKKHMKSFYYQVGLAERTEGFIFFTLMILFPKYVVIFCNIFTLSIIITIIQRFKEAYDILK